jgi:ActR/RegA family two-component response regulator
MVDMVLKWNPPQEPLPLHIVEKDHIFSTLEFFDQNRTQTAKALKIGIRTLQRKLKKYEAEESV